MGKRGPPKTPTDILKNRGTWRANRPDEPQPEGGLPSDSSRLTPEEQAVWDRVTAELEGMGVGREPDSRILERYCALLVLWWKAKKTLEDKGTTQQSVNKSGNVFVSSRPEVSQVNQWGAELRRIEQEFGMTASARAGIKVDIRKPDKPEGKGRFFKAS